MKINIANNEVVHFIGIGGIGMSGLAQIMKNMGFRIQGSDLNRNKNTDRLIKTGIKVFLGHHKKNLKKASSYGVGGPIYWILGPGTNNWQFWPGVYTT